ncbi:thaumatin [Pilobolus umbonatus]|nr:thaumatin [Pilobolus umbonatus]
MLIRLVLIVFLALTVLADKTIYIVNKCTIPISVGILTNGDTRDLPERVVHLKPGDTDQFVKPNVWGGRVWARIHCEGKNADVPIMCGNPGAVLPATLAEFFFLGNNGKDYYDVSLVDGYNMPVSIEPSAKTAPNGYNCGSPTCELNDCPKEYQLKHPDGTLLACLSECSKTNKDEDCCTGDFNSPGMCRASSRSLNVKKACPDAYSYAYDDQDSTFHCQASSFTVTFC